MNDPIPAFEGHAVDATVVKISGSSPLDDLVDTVIGVDDRVQLLATYACVAVHHEIDKNGNLIRVQVLKAQEMALAPFGDDDEGILRIPVVHAIASSSSTQAYGDDDDDE